MSCYLFTSKLSFEYDSAVEPLFSDLTVGFPTGWTGVVGANGSGKSTLLKLLTGGLQPDSGTCNASGPTVLCEQEIVNPPPGLEEFFTSFDVYGCRLRNALALSPEMGKRWATLSMGERKKIQIAIALHAAPDILCLDEPTNHLDAAGRDLLQKELQRFHGIGIIVSHDRELLDALCTQCLFLQPGSAGLRSGNFSAGKAQARIELQNQIEAATRIKKELKRNRLELQRRRAREQQARNRDCKRKLDRRDHDGKARIDAARVTGRDRRQGDLAGAQAETVARTQARLTALGKAKIQQFGLKIPYGEYAENNGLLAVLPGQLPLGEQRKLVYPPLTVGCRDRIGVTGVNGAGKSTLLRFLLPQFQLPQQQILYLPQELDETSISRIHLELQRLSRDEFSKVMNVVASLGSHPERLLDAHLCSPGEWRKLFFGLGVLRRISLIVMDEPTNHLDLPSIECLEAALAQCRCALWLISHDRIFLQNLCSIHWRIEHASTFNLLKKEFF